ncbi:MAG: hypothetical protein GWP58_15510, partial [Gammaproteobacteria bacterium]|nr:hypothetical protein [Gammaproteobacteria bacterium]
MKFFKSIFTPEIRSGIVVAIMTAFLLASFGAQAEDKFPKITPELYDKLNAVDSGMDMDWPHDPAVPDMPPMPVTDDPKMNQDAFLWTHFDDNVYEPRVKGLPTPRTRIVTES